MAEDAKPSGDERDGYEYPSRVPVPRRIRESRDLYVAFLEARVEALEAALARRSEEALRLQKILPPDQLIALARVVNALPPLPRHAYDANAWRETTELVEADVEETLRDLWRSLSPDEPHAI